MSNTYEIEGQCCRQAFENRSVLYIVPTLCKQGRIITNDASIAWMIAEYYHRTVQLHAFDAYYQQNSWTATTMIQ
jgi:hypothetical protein